MNLWEMQPFLDLTGWGHFVRSFFEPVTSLYTHTLHNIHQQPWWEITLHTCTPVPWQPNNVLERKRQMMSIAGSIPWDVSVFPAADKEHYTDPSGHSSHHSSIGYTLYCHCWWTADVQTSPHADLPPAWTRGAQVRAVQWHHQHSSLMSL